MKSNCLLILMCCLISAVALGEPPTSQPSVPTSPEAKAAIAKQAAAVKKAEADFKAAKLVANNTEIAELTKAFDSAMTAKNLDEAIRIKAVIGKLKDEIANGSHSVVTVQAFAKNDWTSYGKVAKGQKIKITASGDWSNNGKEAGRSYADGMRVNGKGMNEACILKGRIGTQEFKIGLGTTITVEESGNFEMRCTDTELSDNSGSLTVKIEPVELDIDSTKKEESLFNPQ